MLEANVVILTSLLATLVVLSIALAVVGYTLARRLAVLRDLQAQHEQVSNALTLLTEATESGFRWTASELQRVTSLQRRSQWPQSVQQRLEQASALGQSVHQIATQEGIPESEVQLRTHLAAARDAQASAAEVPVPDPEVPASDQAVPALDQEVQVGAV